MLILIIAFIIIDTMNAIITIAIIAITIIIIETVIIQAK